MNTEVSGKLIQSALVTKGKQYKYPLDNIYLFDATKHELAFKNM